MGTVKSADMGPWMGPTSASRPHVPGGSSVPMVHVWGYGAMSVAQAQCTRLAVGAKPPYFEGTSARRARTERAPV